MVQSAYVDKDIDVVVHLSNSMVECTFALPIAATFSACNTPVPQSFWLILHSSEARFISSGHLRKTIVSQSDESDLCLSTIRSVSDVSGVI